MAKIIVVEDDPKIMGFITTVLLSAGHEPLTADNGARGREILRAEPDIDLAIFDQHLDEKGDTGLSLLEDVRKHPALATLPVIVCSGDTQPQAVRSFLALKIAAFVKKPFKPERLLADVERVLLEHPRRTSLPVTKVVRGA